MEIQKTALDKWDKWVEEHKQLIRYNLSLNYPTPYSWLDILNLYPDSDTILHEMAAEPIKYGPFTGPIGLRDEIAKFYPGSKIGNILLTHGAVSANDIVIRYLHEDGDNCVCILPTYRQLSIVVDYERYEVRNVYLNKENNYVLDMNALRRAVDINTKIIVLTNPNDPLGVVLSKNQLKEIVEIARSSDAFILCDEVYRFYDYNTPIASVFGLYEKAIAVASFSKFLSIPGIRVGWIVTTEKMVAEFTNLSHFHGRICAILDEKILHLALKKYDVLKNRNFKIAEDNLAIVNYWVLHTAGLSYTKPTGGTTAVVSYSMDVPSIEFCQNMLTETGVRLIPGTLFGLEHTFIVGFLCDTESLTIGLRQIAKTMDAFKLK
jgi:aspartate/methionine/tyrosine aminotransferase